MGKLTIVDLVDKNFNFIPNVFGFENFLKFDKVPEVDYNCCDEFLGSLFKDILSVYIMGGGFAFSRQGLEIKSENYIPFIEKSFFNFMYHKTGLIFENEKQVELYKLDMEKKINKALKERDISKIGLLNKLMGSTEILVGYKSLKELFSLSKINIIYNKKVREEVEIYKGNLNVNDLNKFKNHLLKLYGLERFVV